MARRIVDPPYLAFPFRMTGGTPELADRSRHIRGQVEQVLFTMPGERVCRPEFGAGVKALVFEPNDTPLWQVTKQRLLASLAEALQGEVEPKSIDVQVTSLSQALQNEADLKNAVADVASADASLLITVAYTLAKVGHRESQEFRVGGH